MRKITMSEVAFDKITDNILRIIEESGKLPWVKPWKPSKADGTSNSVNLLTQKHYNGFNAFMLDWISDSFSWGYFWLGYNQAKTLGGKVRTGEKGTPICYPRFGTTIDEHGEEKKIIIGWGYSYVFNVEQIDGIPIPESTPSENAPVDTIIRSAEDIISGYKKCPAIFNDDNSCYYRPSSDEIHMPIKSSFFNIDCYYKSLFHEIIHSTGHKDRLNRKITNSFGDEKYSYEELIAEFGSAFLSGYADLHCEEDGERNSAAYIKGWMSKLKDNKQWLPRAAMSAEKATRYVIGKPKEINDE
jgi:antirestriction protein ArdC